MRQRVSLGAFATGRRVASELRNFIGDETGKWGKALQPSGTPNGMKGAGVDDSIDRRRGAGPVGRPFGRTRLSVWNNQSIAIAASDLIEPEGSPDD